MRHFEHGDQVAADLVIGIDHLLHAAAGTVSMADHQLVGQENGERLVADNRPRTPDRMAEAQRHLLANRDEISRGEAGRLEDFERLGPVAHRRFEFVGNIEVIDDRGLAAAGHEDHLLDPRLARLVHRILDQRPVDDRQHFLGDRLGGGQEARAEAGDGEHGFADGFADGSCCGGIAADCYNVNHRLAAPRVSR